MDASVENTPELRMTFDPNTIQHLGVKMYSNIPTAVAELIANAYDAAATEVHITLMDKDDVKSIEVTDNGSGMSFDDINNKFLRIGRNRRQEGELNSPDGKRKATGKKGLGKLALFGLGNLISVSTVQMRDEQTTDFTLSWDDLLNTKGDYKPNFGHSPVDGKVQGTKILLTNIRRQSAFDVQGLASSLARLFECFDKTFRCFIHHGEDTLEVTKDMRYEGVTPEFEWNFPDFLINSDIEYAQKGQISGRIFSTEKPLKPGLRGITLYANGRLVNAPEFFGVSESSHGFSYLAGYLNVDFVDDIEEDAISTNRQSLNWQLPETELLRDALYKTIRAIENNWRLLRAEKRRAAVQRELGVDRDAWYRKLPREIRDKIRPLVETVIDDSELPADKQAQVVQTLHQLIPEYPYYHWRHLHPAIAAVSATKYKNADYYSALFEAVKHYADAVRAKWGKGSELHTEDSNLMGAAFGDKAYFTVTKIYSDVQGVPFKPLTLKNVEVGQRELSQGVVAGYRNPIAHEQEQVLRDSGLLTEKDCLDALSMISHLYRRLEDAVVRPPEPGVTVTPGPPKPGA